MSAQRWSDAIAVINGMDLHHHIMIGAILRKYPGVKLNENACGVMVNVSTVSDEVLNEVSQYLNYVVEQENMLQNNENEKEQYKAITEFRNINKNELNG